MKIPCDRKKKPNYTAGWRVRPPSARSISFLLITHECIKDRTNVEKADIDIFVITGGNLTQTALYTVWCSAHSDCALCVD